MYTKVAVLYGTLGQLKQIILQLCNNRLQPLQ